jgi:hypothetical protein
LAFAALDRASRTPGHCGRFGAGLFGITGGFDAGRGILVIS